MDVVLHAVTDDNNITILDTLECLSIELNILKSSSGILLLDDTSTHAVTSRSASTSTYLEVCTEAVKLACCITIPPIEGVVSSQEQLRLIASVEFNRLVNDTAEFSDVVTYFLTCRRRDRYVLEERVNDILRIVRESNEVRLTCLDA